MWSSGGIACARVLGQGQNIFLRFAAKLCNIAPCIQSTHTAHTCGCCGVVLSKVASTYAQHSWRAMMQFAFTMLLHARVLTWLYTVPQDSINSAHHLDTSFCQCTCEREQGLSGHWLRLAPVHVCMCVFVVVVMFIYARRESRSERARMQWVIVHSRVPVYACAQEGDLGREGWIPHEARAAREHHRAQKAQLLLAMAIPVNERIECTLFRNTVR